MALASNFLALLIMMPSAIWPMYAIQAVSDAGRNYFILHQAAVRVEFSSGTRHTVSGASRETPAPTTQLKLQGISTHLHVL